jgi:hypothetical protein
LITASPDVYRILSFIGDDPKRDGDFTFAELHAFVSKATQAMSESAMSERSFRRILRGLRISKSERGYYTNADAVLFIGWLKRRHKYASYQEYLEREGKVFYQKAQQFGF